MESKDGTFDCTFIFGFIHIMSAVFAGNLLEWVQIFLMD